MSDVVGSGRSNRIGSDGGSVGVSLTVHSSEMGSLIPIQPTRGHPACRLLTTDGTGTCEDLFEGIRIVGEGGRKEESGQECCTSREAEAVGRGVGVPFEAAYCQGESRLRSKLLRWC